MTEITMNDLQAKEFQLNNVRNQRAKEGTKGNLFITDQEDGIILTPIQNERLHISAMRSFVRTINSHPHKKVILGMVKGNGYDWEVRIIAKGDTKAYSYLLKELTDVIIVTESKRKNV